MFRRMVVLPSLLLCAPLLSSLLTPQVQAQAPASLDSVRAALRDLESKLQELEQPANDPFSGRTTRIGESKPVPKPVDDDALVIQLYDLSDLFAITPAYPALHHSDLAAASRTLFPVVGGAERAPAYAPVTSVVQDGAALQVTPLTSSQAKYVVLDVHSRVALLSEPGAPVGSADGKPQRLGPAQDAVSAVDRPVVSTHRLSTTLRVPTGQVYLVGGMSGDRTCAPPDMQLYLFVQAFVQELRDDPPGVAEEK